MTRFRLGATPVATRGWKRFRRATLVDAARRHRGSREKKALTLTTAAHAVRHVVRETAREAAREKRRQAHG